MADAALPHVSDEQFERALCSPDRVEALRSIALGLAAQGHRRQQVYDAFLPFYRAVQARECVDEESALGDVMDMIAGTYAPFNLDIPR